MTLLSNWDDNTLPSNGGLVYNEIWGWYDDTKDREYAIIGSLARTYFIDITDPYNPVVADSVEGGHNNCIHRDYKTYGKYCYAVADEGSGSTLQIIDMSYLPDSVHKVYDSNQFFRRSHNIFIDTVAGRLYAVGCNTQWTGVIILDIKTNPTQPTVLLDSSLGNYTHDLYVINDTGYLNNGSSGLKVWDFTNASSPVAIGQLPSYAQSGYNHSCWRTEDGKHLVMCDETHNKACKVVDVQTPSNMSVISFFKSMLMFPNDTTSIPHNPLVAGDYACVSYYHDGVQIFDISDPLNPTQFAWYDTDNISTNYGGYHGCWGVYPYLPSGTIIASDTRNGLFCLRADFPFPYPLNTNISVTDVTCNGSADGTAWTAPTGGTGPYSYLWSTGDTMANVIGLDTGMHTVTLYDVYGNSIVDTIYVSQQPSINTSASITGATCPAANDGSIDYSISGGLPPYTFSWSTGATTEDVDSLTPGTYVVTVFDSANCIHYDTIVVSSSNSLQAFAGFDDTACDTNHNMAATISAGANGTWTQLSGPSVVQFADSTDKNTAVSFGAAGNYSLIWTGSSGPCSISDTVDIEVSNAAYADAGPDQVVCNSAALLNAVTPDSGTAVWSVLSGGGSLINSILPNSGVTNLSPGNNLFLWTVTDGNCQVGDTAAMFYQLPVVAGFSTNGNNMTVNFTDTSANANEWHWDFGDGDSSSAQSPSHTYTSNGSWVVCLHVTNECGTDSTCKEIMIPFVGLDPLIEALRFDIYPNPNSGNFHIKGEVEKGMDLSLKITDVLGRTIKQKELGWNAGEFDEEVQIKEAGMYFISIGDASRNAIRTVIITQ